MKQLPVFKSLSRLDNFLKYGDTGHQDISLPLTRHGNPLSLVLSPKVSIRYQGQKSYSVRGFIWIILLAVWNLKSFESYMNLLTLPLVNPRHHHIGKLKGIAFLLFEAFMRAYFDAYMKLLYPSLVGINGSIYTVLNNFCLYLQSRILSFMNKKLLFIHTLFKKQVWIFVTFIT